MSYSRYGCACAQCAEGGSGNHDPLASDSWQPANVSPTPIVSYAYTGDYRIDCLIEGLSYRWNAGQPLGTKATVTYSFMGMAPWYGGNEGEDTYGFSQFNAAQKAAAREILGKLETELNIDFVEVSDSLLSYGQIRFGNNEQLYSSGYAWLPGSGSDLSGDIWLDSLTPSNLNPTAGSWGYSTLVHEIGHALGLKHPGNYNAGTIAEDTPGNYLGTNEDNANYTIMSYYDAAGAQPRDWFASYDLLALKKLYGGGTINAGNTTHKYTDASGARLSIIDDSSGSDTIDLSGLTLGAKVDMRPGGFSSVGRNGGTAAVDNLSIDLTTTVENLVGTAWGDVVTGNAANNRFTLGAGTNSADGAGGLDTAVYGHLRGYYQVSGSGSGVSVTGNGARDTLTNVERLEFANGKLAFDFDGNAGSVARILGAVFDAGAVGDAQYVKAGLSLMDGGTNALATMDIALDYALGTNASNAAVVNLVFSNIAGFAPSAGQLAYFTGLISSGAYSQAGLALAGAESAENAFNIDLVGLTSVGLAYA